MRLRVTRLRIAALSVATLLVLVLLATAVCQRGLPQDLRAVAAQTTVEVLDRDGQPLQLAYDGGWNVHEQRALEQLPLLLRTAFVAAEDRRYWQHTGVDWTARLAALRVNLRSGRVLRGASTISEQVVRILHPRPRTLWSRWVEGFEALRLEARFSKSQILEFYLNQVPYGANRRGVVQAAQYYFGRSLDTLSPDETLALAVLVRAPSRLAADPPALQARVQGLRQYLQLAADTQPLHLLRATPKLRAAHFVAWVQRQADARSGQRVRSSLDPALQADAEAYLDERLHELAREGARQAALLVVDLDGNRVRAYASADSEQEEVVGIDPLQAPRQPGSALKPLLYALALERGWRADTVIDDSMLRERVGSGLHEYRNYSRVHYGAVTVAEALGNSLNIPAVKALQFVGQPAFLERLQALGVRSLRQPAAYYGDGLALGNGELSLYELVQAYTALARDGRWQPLSVFEDSASVPQMVPRQIIARDAARTISDILADADTRLLEFGEGGVLRFPLRTAVKTGTSSDYRDAWTLAYNGRWLVGVWVGNLSGRATEGVTGARGPALLARSLLARLPEAQTPLHAAPPSTPVATVPAAEGPAMPVLLQPFDGLLLASDPRIPASLQAFRFELAWREVPVLVRWELDGQLLAESTGMAYDWPLQRGEHVLRATVIASDGRQQSSEAARFSVR